MTRRPVVLVPVVLVLAGAIAGCSGSSDDAGPKDTTTTTTRPATTTTAPGPTDAQLAEVPSYLAGRGAPLLRFVRETASLAGARAPTPAECTRILNEVLPTIAENPGALREIASAVPDPALAELFVTAIGAKTFFITGCAERQLPDATTELARRGDEPLRARLALYGITV